MTRREEGMTGREEGMTGREDNVSFGLRSTMTGREDGCILRAAPSGRALEMTGSESSRAQHRGHPERNTGGHPERSEGSPGPSGDQTAIPV